MNRRMVVKGFLDRLTVVSRKVVGNDIDFFATGLTGNDTVEEGDKSGRGGSCGSLTGCLTCNFAQAPLIGANR